MPRIAKLFTILLLFCSVTTSGQGSGSPAGYVDPFIGTGGHGHTFPGASVPFGMVQLSPDTRLTGWDGCSGYYGTDTVIYGFSHTHLSGTGCSDYGDILLMPFTGTVDLANYGYQSVFHPGSDEEYASPGYYRVLLSRYGIKAELTATLRSGFHRYTFPEAMNAGIVIDLKHRDKVLDSYLRVVSPTEVEGMRISDEWARKQILYFVVRFSKPFSSCRINRSDDRLFLGSTVHGDSIIAAFNFPTRKDETVLVKIGISAVSPEGARKNLDTENPGWDFERISADASDAWNRELGKITVKGGTEDQRTLLYSALYHAFLTPNLYMDVDGKYRGRDFAIHTAEGYDHYTVFSLWDTYRAAHPLYILTQPKRDNDFILTFLAQYRDGGRLPVWELSANETDCMIGYHAVPVIADAYVKGIRDFDPGLALNAMKHSAEEDWLGLKYYKTLGFIPGDQEGESVSKTLEYCFDDWCIASMAHLLGKEDDYLYYIRRAQNYKNLFDPGTGFMRARMNNTFHFPFDPAEVNFNYTEANSWQYSFYVPHDFEGLMLLHGGRDAFTRRLDAMFGADSKTTGRDQSDISGMIGQYAHGNEPSHHMAYLYDYVGEPWKTQEMVHRICSSLYGTGRDGLCGNEDCGQMSAWYVMSAMGFYPVTPGSTSYAVGTPVFPELSLRLENGKTFTVKAESVSDQNIYIQDAKLNGVPYAKCYIDHSDIIRGGELTFTLGPVPNKNWGSAPGDYPVTAIRAEKITPVPFLEYGKKNFSDNTKVKLGCAIPEAKIYYTLDGSDPGNQSPLASGPFILDRSCILKAVAKVDGVSESNIATAVFQRIPKNRSITLNTKYSPQYTAGGDQALVDFERGSENFRTGSWQGYEGVDLDATVDLGSSQEIHTLSAGFLQDQGSWIFFPTEVVFSLSSDGVTFQQSGIAHIDIPDTVDGSVKHDFTISLPAGSFARYVKILGKNRGLCPEWHPGAGKKAWLFADEIVVE